MNANQRQRYWLARQLADKETLFFSLIVEVAPDSEGAFSGTVVGLEERIGAGGDSPEAASAWALLLFREMVDNGIEASSPERELDGSGIRTHRLPIPFDEIAGFVKELQDQDARDQAVATRKTASVWREAAVEPESSLAGCA